MKTAATEKIKPKNLYQKVNLILILTSCLFYILLIRTTINAVTQYNRLQDFTETYIACQKADAQLAAGSDYLTEQARMYVITQDEQNLLNYFAEAEETRRRERAINELAAYQPQNATYDYLTAALDASNLLMQREFYAMKLTALAQGTKPGDMPESLQNIILIDEDLILSSEEMLTKAQDLVFNERYNLSKNTINKNLEYAISSLLNTTIQEQQNAKQNLDQTINVQFVLISILFLENLLLAALFWLHHKHRLAKNQPPQIDYQPSR